MSRRVIRCLKTRTEQPGWDDRGERGPRVLLENSDIATGWMAKRVLEREGYAVAACGGPDALHRHRCPLVSQGSCALADGADVIVHSLNPDRREHLAVLRALRAQYPRTPLVIEMPAPALQRHREDVRESTFLRFPATRDSLTSAVRVSLERPMERAASRPARVADGDGFACARCGATHTVFTIDGEPRLQAVRCGQRTVPIARENEPFRDPGSS